MAKRIKVSTIERDYKILNEYDPTTQTVLIRIRKNDEIYKQLSISLHSLTGLKRIVDENDDIQTSLVLSALSSLQTHLSVSKSKLPDIFINGAFNTFKNHIMNNIIEEG